MENWNNFPSSSIDPPPLIIPHPNQNPAPAMPIEMPQFDQSSYQTDNVVFEQLQTTMLPPPPPSQNQPLRIENGFRPGDQSKKEADIFYENYLEQYYGSDSPPIGTAVNRSCDAEFDDFLNSDPAPMKNFSDFDCLNFEDNEITGHYNSNYGATQFRTSSTYNNLSTMSPAPMERTGLLSDAVNFCSYKRRRLAAVNSTSTEFPPAPRNGAVAATYGGASSSEIKKTWNVQEHKLLLVGMEIFGSGDWKNIANKVVLTKTHTQVASHAQKYFLRQQLPKERVKRMSIHDHNTVDPELLLEVCARLGLRPPPMLSDDQTEQCEPVNNHVPINLQ